MQLKVDRGEELSFVEKLIGEFNKSLNNVQAIIQDPVVLRNPRIAAELDRVVANLLARYNLSPEHTFRARPTDDPTPPLSSGNPLPHDLCPDLLAAAEALYRQLCARE